MDSGIEIKDIRADTLEVPLSDGPPQTPSQYDVCIVLPLITVYENGEYDYVVKPELVEVLDRIIGCLGRKYVYMYNSVYRKARFVLLRGGTSRLKSKAEQIGFRMPLNEDSAYLMAFAGDQEKGIKRIEIVHRPQATPFKPFEYIWGRYKADPTLEDLYDLSTNRSNDDDEHSGNSSKSALQLLGQSTLINTESLFTKTMRIRLLMRILTDHSDCGGANVNLYNMYEQGEINGFYPLHDSYSDRKALTKSLMYNAWPHKQPLNDIQIYFGPRVGYIFAFMSHYVTWLIIPALLGCTVQIVGAIQWNFDRIEACAFALFMSLWAIFAYEYWKRKEKYLAMCWGTLDSDHESSLTDDDAERAAFKGTVIKSYIDGSEMKYYDPAARFRRYLLSGFAFFVVCCVAAGAVGGIYFTRSVVFANYDNDFTQIAASTANAVVIIALNMIVRKLARWLCNLENHRTEQEYEESLAIKLFVFQFVNSYTSFYYLAFGAKYMTGYLGVGGEYDATVSLGVNLAAILIVRSVCGNTLRMFVPWVIDTAIKFLRSEHKCRATCHNCRWFWMSAVKKCVCRYICCRVDLAYDDDTYEEDEIYQQHLLELQQKRQKKKKQKMRERGEEVSDDEEEEEEGKAVDEEVDEPKESEAERRERLSAEHEYNMRRVDSSFASETYADQLVIFGYMSLFIAACPGAVCLGCIAYFLEFRGTLWLMLHGSRRPIPEECEGIGLWHDAMELMIILAVCTNAGVVVFTMKTFEDYSGFQRMGIFVLFQYAAFLIMYILQLIIRDEPPEVSIQRQRQKFITDKLVEQKADKERVDPMELL